jgi:hypothetical protein
MVKRKGKRERIFGSGGPGGRILAQPGAGAGSGLARPKGGRRRGRARKRRRGHGAHAPGRVGGDTASAADGAGANRPTCGENLAAGGFNGGSPPVTRFLGIGQVPKHKEGLARLRVSPILPGETGRELTAVRWRSSTAGVVAGEVWVVIGGRGAVFRVRGDVAKLLSLVNFSLNNQRRGGGRGGAYQSGGRATELVRWSSGRGRRVAEAGAGHGGARGGPFIGA